MLRVTTSSVLKNYRLNLTKSRLNLESSQNTVLSQRNFNSYAEDPALASECFTLRRSYLRSDMQQDNCSAIISQYEVAWSAMEGVISDVSNEKSTSAYAAVMEGLSDPTGAGRYALGQNLLQIAESLTQSMNVKYGDSYVFAGADGLTAPFEWQDGELCYLGLSVDDEANQEALDQLAAASRYVDIGLGLQENANGELLPSTAFNAAMPGINYLGYGVDEEGDPKNVISLIHRMGTILSGCDNDGKFANEGDQEELTRLFDKFGTSSDNLSTKHVEMDTQASFLKQNLSQLEDSAYVINEQIIDLEQADLAEAITAFSWAQYCYNAALKVGNSVLSESLMDYMTV